MIKIRFTFNGTVKKFGFIFATNKTYTTYAESSRKAITNILYQIKQSNNLSNGAKLELSGRLICNYSFDDEIMIVKDNVIKEPECELLDMYCKQIGDSNKYKLKKVDNTFADAFHGLLGSDKFSREQFIEFVNTYVEKDSTRDEYSFDEEEGVYWENGERFGNHR